MALPIQFLARFAIPLIVAAFYMDGNGPEQTALYDKILEESDRTLSLAEGDGEGPTEFYDYIIIGAGSAGSVLANRLTASGTERVLLLEAGGDPNPISEVPMFQDYLWVSDMMLPYVTTKQEHACIVEAGGECIFPRGRAMGGSSSVNGLVYNRCNPKDYDSWANFTNDPIWSFNSVVDAFKTVENYEGVYADNPGPNHGIGGELHINHLNFIPGFHVLSDALIEKGIPIGDLNSGLFPSGFSKLDHNIKDGLRWSTYHGFLEPILGRSNLKVYRYAWATKIHLDSAKKAIGVTYRRHGQSRYVGVNKEIIVAAGVIDTPKLLMLSGIGPAAHLAEHGIETVVDLPAVGSHLQEHLGVNMYPWSINQTYGLADPLTPENINLFIKKSSGPLANMKWWDTYAIHIAHGYFPSKTYNDPSWPDLHVYVNQLVASPPGKPVEQQIIAELELVLTDQTGTLRLASANPEDDPIINPHFMENPMDIERMVEGIEYLEDLFLNSTVFQSLGIKWSDNFERIPQCEQHTFPSKPYWRCFVEMNTHPALHPTSTCRMGPNSSVAVVDSRLRVFNTTGLRIIDSSVMPFVPNGNTNHPSIMIGEMGARMILNQI